MPGVVGYSCNPNYLVGRCRGCFNDGNSGVNLQLGCRGGSLRWRGLSLKRGKIRAKVIELGVVGSNPGSGSSISPRSNKNRPVPKIRG